MSITCTTTVNNLSIPECVANYGQITRVWLEKEESTITLANALLEATWTAKIQAADTSRLSIVNMGLPYNALFEREDDVVLTGNTGKFDKVRDGYDTLTLTFSNLKLCQVKKLKTYDNLKLYAYFITENEYIIGGGDDTNIKSVPVYVHVSNVMPQADNDTQWTVTMKFRFVRTKDNFINAVDVWQDGSGWRATETEGIIDVVLTVISAGVSANEVVVDITRYCDNTEIAASTWGQTTEYTDFVVELVSTGVACTTTAISTSGNTATLTVTGMSTNPHRIYLKQVENAVQKGYETYASATFTPSA